jgi:MATE family multidrug resistance protein
MHAKLNRLVSRLCGLLAFYQVFDSMNAYAQGVFRGSGHQSEGAVINFVSYYCVGLPLAAVFAFRRKWGLWVST